MKNNKLISDIYDFMQNSDLTEEEKDKVYELMQSLSAIMTKND